MPITILFFKGVSKMKHKMLLLPLAAMLFGWCGAMAQPELNVVWEKNIWPTEIKFAKFSKDGQWLFCAINNTIVKMNQQTGELHSEVVINKLCYC